MSTTRNPPPHVLVLPFPVQGHVTPMLAFSHLLCHVGIHVTFVNTEYNHRRLDRDLSGRFPELLRFAAVPDGFPAGHDRGAKHMVVELVESYESFAGAAAKPLRDLLAEAGGSRPAVTCVVADGLMSFAYDIAEELGIRVVAFRTIPATALWAYFCVPLLVQKGELPFPDNEMDQIVNGIPGMEGVFRRRDLPSLYRLPLNDFLFDFFVKQTQALTRASALILNTVDALEPEALDQMASHFPSIYTIGSVRSLLQRRINLHNNTEITDTSGEVSSGALWREDRDCMTWLDSQPSRSVVYVSFGSLAKVTCQELREIWHGLIDSGTRFLFVVRSEMISDEDHVIPQELQMGTSETSFLVDWVPQEEVLAHFAVGGFLTHSGWNSTLEAIVAGVPMLCWPKSGDQQVIGRWVSEVWKIGLDMKDSCDRATIRKMIKCLMEDRRVEIARSMKRVSKLALEAVGEGGSSNKNFENFVERLRKD